MKAKMPPRSPPRKIKDYRPSKIRSAKEAYRPFQFISIDRPEDTNSSANRRVIRSQAARAQHSQSTSSTTTRRVSHTNAVATTLYFHMSSTACTVVPAHTRPLNELDVVHVRPRSQGEKLDVKELGAPSPDCSPAWENMGRKQNPAYGRDNLKLCKVEKEEEDVHDARRHTPSSRAGASRNGSEFRHRTSSPSSVSSENLFLADNSYLDAGNVDPFQTLPLPWQPFMSELIHHFFIHFSPSQFVENHPRNLIKFYWWPLILSSPALCSATLLMLASHRANQMSSHVTTPSHLWLKALCLKHIRGAMKESSDRISDSTIGAMLTLAACEFLYCADYDMYHFHMRAVKKSIELRGGFDALDPKSPLTLLLYCAGHDLVIFVGGAPYFEHHSDATWHQFQQHATSPSMKHSMAVSLPLSVQKLVTNKLVSSRQVELIETLMPMLGENRHVNGDLLRRVEEQLFDWTGGWVTSSCPFHGYAEDEVVIQADQCLRMSLLCLVYRIIFSVGMLDGFFVSRRSQITGLLGSLDFAALKTTVYGELLFWHVMLCRNTEGSLSSSDLDMLAYLIAKHEVRDWQGMKALMEKFPYAPGLCDVVCKATWEQVVHQLRKDSGGVWDIGATTPTHGKSRYELLSAPTAFPNLFNDAMRIKSN